MLRRPYFKVMAHGLAEPQDQQNSGGGIAREGQNFPFGSLQGMVDHLGQVHGTSARGAGLAHDDEAAARRYAA